ncbi:hypothetical protein IWW37_005722 [Coemansia sp. RSA 2050]|nr:hypothetical protein IWW37_005722 [Coemansia sp. RSA 2050]KAJ2729281.1 hypothetical protein IW152_005685 [Coemansia sp. BCRC 34962]
MNILSFLTFLIISHLVLAAPLAPQPSDQLIPLGALTNYRIVVPKDDGTYSTLPSWQVNEYTRNFFRYLRNMNRTPGNSNKKPERKPKPPVGMPTIKAPSVPTLAPKVPEAPLFSTRPMELPTYMAPSVPELEMPTPTPTNAPKFTTYAPSELWTKVFT